MPAASVRMQCSRCQVALDPKGAFYGKQDGKSGKVTLFCVKCGAAKGPATKVSSAQTAKMMRPVAGRRSAPRASVRRRPRSSLRRGRPSIRVLRTERVASNPAGVRVGKVRIHRVDDPAPDSSYLEQAEWEDRLEAYRQGDFGFIGIYATAEIVIPKGKGVIQVQQVRSGGLWGIESDSDEAYFKEVEGEELKDLRDTLTKLKIPAKAVSSAIADAETVANPAHGNSIMERWWNELRLQERDNQIGVRHRALEAWLNSPYCRDRTRLGKLVNFADLPEKFSGLPAPVQKGLAAYARRRQYWSPATGPRAIRTNPSPRGRRAELLSKARAIRRGKSVLPPKEFWRQRMAAARRSHPTWGKKRLARYVGGIWHKRISPRGQARIATALARRAKSNPRSPEELWDQMGNWLSYKQQWNYRERWLERNTGFSYNMRGIYRSMPASQIKAESPKVWAEIAERLSKSRMAKSARTEANGSYLDRSEAWDVILGGKVIDRVFYTTGRQPETVRRDLIDHDGYDPGITVRRASRPRQWKANPGRGWVCAEGKMIKRGGFWVADPDDPPRGCGADNSAARTTCRICGSSRPVKTNPRDLRMEDKIGGVELRLYIDNDGQLYRQMKVPIYAMLMRRKKAGTYRSDLATKAFMNLADEGARRYIREHASGQRMDLTFNRATRWAVAESLKKYFEDEAALGNMDWVLEKKHTPRANPRRNPGARIVRPAVCRKVCDAHQDTGGAAGGMEVITTLYGGQDDPVYDIGSLDTDGSVEIMSTEPVDPADLSAAQKRVANNDNPVWLCRCCQHVLTETTGASEANPGKTGSMPYGPSWQAKVPASHLRVMWELLHTVPLDTKGQITKAFYGWPKGEPYNEIAQWFDEKYPGGVGFLLQEGIAIRNPSRLADDWNYYSDAFVKQSRGVAKFKDTPWNALPRDIKKRFQEWLSLTAPYIGENPKGNPGRVRRMTNPTANWRIVYHFPTAAKALAFHKAAGKAGFIGGTADRTATVGVNKDTATKALAIARRFGVIPATQAVRMEKPRAGVPAKCPKGHRTLPDSGGAYCEKCRIFTCGRCKKWKSMDKGGDNDAPGLCDDCWSAVTSRGTKPVPERWRGDLVENPRRGAKIKFPPCPGASWIHMDAEVCECDPRSQDYDSPKKPGDCPGASPVHPDGEICDCASPRYFEEGFDSEKNPLTAADYARLDRNVELGGKAIREGHAIAAAGLDRIRGAVERLPVKFDDAAANPRSLQARMDRRRVRCMMCNVSMARKDSVEIGEGFYCLDDAMSSHDASEHAQTVNAQGECRVCEGIKAQGGTPQMLEANPRLTKREKEWGDDSSKVLRYVTFNVHQIAALPEQDRWEFYNLVIMGQHPDTFTVRETLQGYGQVSLNGFLADKAATWLKQHGIQHGVTVKAVGPEHWAPAKTMSWMAAKKEAHDAFATSDYPFPEQAESEWEYALELSRKVQRGEKFGPKEGTDEFDEQVQMAAEDLLEVMRSAADESFSRQAKARGWTDEQLQAFYDQSPNAPEIDWAENPRSGPNRRSIGPKQLEWGSGEGQQQAFMADEFEGYLISAEQAVREASNDPAMWASFKRNLDSAGRIWRTGRFKVPGTFLQRLGELRRIMDSRGGTRVGRKPLANPSLAEDWNYYAEEFVKQSRGVVKFKDTPWNALPAEVKNRFKEWLSLTAPYIGERRAANPRRARSEAEWRSIHNTHRGREMPDGPECDDCQSVWDRESRREVTDLSLSNPRDTVYFDHTGGRWEGWTYSDGQRIPVGEWSSRGEAAGFARSHGYRAVWAARNPSHRRNIAPIAAALAMKAAKKYGPKIVKAAARAALKNPLRRFYAGRIERTPRGSYQKFLWDLKTNYRTWLVSKTREGIQQMLESEKRRLSTPEGEAHAREIVMVRTELERRAKGLPASPVFPGEVHLRGAKPVTDANPPAYLMALHDVHGAVQKVGEPADYDAIVAELVRRGYSKEAAEAGLAMAHDTGWVIEPKIGKYMTTHGPRGTKVRAADLRRMKRLQLANPGATVKAMKALYKAGKKVEKKTGIPMSGASIVGRVAGKKAEKKLVKTALQAAGTLANPAGLPSQKQIDLAAKTAEIFNHRPASRGRVVKPISTAGKAVAVLGNTTEVSYFARKDTFSQGQKRRVGKAVKKGQHFRHTIETAKSSRGKVLFVPEKKIPGENAIKGTVISTMPAKITPHGVEDLD